MVRAGLARLGMVKPILDTQYMFTLARDYRSTLYRVYVDTLARQYVFTPVISYSSRSVL